MSQSTPNPSEVRMKLRAVLLSSTFRDSERHSRLLQFLVESTLAGKAGDLKEFIIAAEVWGRDISFDPRIHSTVRVEVGRLRTRLERYYAADGLRDDLRFRIPTGGYAVQFESAATVPATTIIESARFEILEPLGRGGMGEIYKARDTRLGRLVALKFIPEDMVFDQAAIVRFEVEARAAAAINHPNICTIYDAGILNGRPFLAMELLEGQTIRHRLQSGPIPIETFLNWAIQLSEGLDAAHKSGIVHRDLKPANLFVTTRDQAKILDFGLAILRDRMPETTSDAGSSGPSGASNMVGTLGYMSPEQNRGEQLDSRSDLFSLGAVFYEMLTGVPAFSESNVAETHRATLESNPPPPSSLASGASPELDRIVLKALEKDRELRYQNAADLRADLRRLKRDSDSQRTIPPADLSIPPAKAVEAKPVRLDRKWLIAAFCALALLVAAGTWILLRTRNHKLGGDDKVVLAEFTNTTGDPIFDAALRQGLAAQLEQSPFLGLVSDARIAQTMQLMAQPKGARLTPELARQVCQRTGSAAVIEGAIASLGSQYVLGLRALNCANGDLLTQVQETADRKEQVLAALGRAASQLRRKLGESLPSIEKYDVPPESVTTGSLDALQAYGLGEQAQGRGDGPSAIAAFRRAIALDPNFAMAYARLGVVLNGTTEAQDVTRKAYALRDRVSDRERLYLVSHYQQYATGNLEQARNALELWARTYPHDPDPPSNLFKLYVTDGQYDQALTAVKEVIKNSPGTPALNATRLATTLIFLNRLDEAKAVLMDAVSHKFDAPVHHCFLYEIDVLQHDANGAERERAYVSAQEGWQYSMLDLESLTAASSGQFKRHRDLSDRVAKSSADAHENDDEGANLAEAALQEALAGSAEIAQKKALTAINLSHDLEPEALAGLSLALAGNFHEADSVASDLNKRHPENTEVQLVVSTIRATILLGDGKSPEAARKSVEALIPSAPYELSAMFYMVPVYVRGKAFLAAGKSAEAKIEFQKILDHPGVTRNFVMGSLAHLYMGQALAMGGETQKARAEYETFLALWKDADQDLPTLKLAKASLAALPQ